MTVGERIKQLCRLKGITVKKLEQDLGYGNGSIATSNDKIQSNRALEIADYLGVTINFLLTGNEIPYLESPVPAATELAELTNKYLLLNETNKKILMTMIDSLLQNQ